MRKTILSSLLACMIGFASLAYANSRFEASAWQEACTLGPYKCDNVVPPVVEYDETGLEFGLWGYYMLGTRVVFLSVGMPVEQEYSVLVHEMVHYLQYNYYKQAEVGQITKCQMEAEAFAVSDQVLKRLGREDLARNGDLTDYGCGL